MGSTSASSDPARMKVVIVGAGIAGLATAIGCLREGIEVEILEKAPEILPVGAGIQVPPNAAHILRTWGLADKFSQRGGVLLSSLTFRRYKDGKILFRRPGGERMVEDYGDNWYVIHRADYHMLLLEEAKRLGAEIQLGADVTSLETLENPHVVLQDGRRVYGDVIVAADGLWSACRDHIVGASVPAKETGDLAYRGTFSSDTLKELNNQKISTLMEQDAASIWMGPDRHCVFYPVKNRKTFNLVLIRPDDLPAGTRTAKGDILEMRESFKGWDPIEMKPITDESKFSLTMIISKIETVLKWKLCTLEELKTWTKGHSILIGDASHPTLPYQAQGAAMAVEDGAVLASLLGKFLRSSQCSTSDIPALLHLFENLRKNRTTTIVEGANQNRIFYHMPDGPEQSARDEVLAKVDWTGKCEWQMADIESQRELLCFDVEKQTQAAFRQWLDEDMNV